MGILSDKPIVQEDQLKKEKSAKMDQIGDVLDYNVIFTNDALEARMGNMARGEGVFFYNNKKRTRAGLLTIVTCESTQDPELVP